MALREGLDKDLQARPVGYLFGKNLARVAFKKGVYLRNFVLKFAEMLGDRLDAKLLAKALSGQGDDYEY